MAYNDPRDKSSPFIPSDQDDGIEAELLDGWDAAAAYHHMKRVVPRGPKRAKVLELAIDAVLQKAMDCVRHAARPTRVSEYAWAERPGGDFDLEASLDAGLLPGLARPEQLRVTERHERRADVVLVLDMSLSMTGEKVALVAVAAAILGLKLASDGLGVIVFDSTAHVVKGLDERLSVRELIRRILEFPARGFTHLEEGLRRALDMLRRARQPHRVGVLMSDGIFNVGWNPAPLAPLFPRLHVMHLAEEEREKSDKGLCRQLASSGRGRYYRADKYEDLPTMTYQLVQDLFR